MSQAIFENIKHLNEYGNEYWMAREFAKVLEYKDFGNFENAIEKAKLACGNSGQEIDDHFGDTTEMLAIGSGASRKFPSYRLSRYACYLIIQNADPSKEIVALGQTYFALQTRKQELQQQNIEDTKRKYLRDEMKKHNSDLAAAAKDAGIVEPIDYAIFQNFGYMGLYNGLDTKGIHAKKGLKKSQKILDHMGSEELAANLFRATQAEAKLRREKIVGKQKANIAHMEVGKEVRDTIQKLGGTMPEDLPPVENITQTEKRLKESSPDRFLSE